MTRFLTGLILTAGAGISALLATASGRPAPERSVPVPRFASPAVLELFQSQGCSSCPPALAILQQEADQPGVIALSFAVTYWDQLGWKDVFAQPAFTRRQWDYAHAYGRGLVATPQLVVNGRGFVNGGNKAEVDSAIDRYRMPSPGPALRLDGGYLVVGASRNRRSATIWLVSFDPRTLQVPIRAGENDGRTLPHRNIVRKLENLGAWTGLERRLKPPPPRPGLSRAVLLQAGTGGPILAARKLD